MGAWGSSLYANDTTLDVKDTYMEHLKNQKSNEEALSLTLSTYEEYMGTEEECFVWLALADTQWKLGRLTEEIKDRALLLIEQEAGLELWEDSANKGTGWKKTLNKLKDKLESDQPEEKIIRKPKEYIVNPWNVGDVYALQFKNESAKEIGIYEKYVLIEKVGDKEISGRNELVKESVVKVYSTVFDEIPDISVVETLKILPTIDLRDYKEYYGTLTDENNEVPIIAEVMMYGPRSYKKDKFTYVGTRDIKYDIEGVSWKHLSWRDMDKTITDCLKDIQGYDYELDDEGRLIDVFKI